MTFVYYGGQKAAISSELRRCCSTVSGIRKTPKRLRRVVEAVWRVSDLQSRLKLLKTANKLWKSIRDNRRSSDLLEARSSVPPLARRPYLGLSDSVTCYLVIGIASNCFSEVVQQRTDRNLAVDFKI